jgi:membrane fusion protein
MTIVPEGAEMVAVLYVPSRGIGFLQPGQEVRLRYDAFPFQRFGAANARVKSISQTVLRPEEVNAAVQLQEPAYTVVTILDDQQMAAYGKTYSLHPGMALTADIVAEERSFAAWLFEPLLALKGRF